MPPAQRSHDNLPRAPGLREVLMALAVVSIWGVNFVVIKVGLRGGVPPFLMGLLRFALVAFPAIFLIPRPRVAWRWLVAYGLTISLGQFAFLFSAMSVGMPAGLASLVLQAQTIFTLALSAIFLGDRLHGANVVGLLLAMLGLLILGSYSMPEASGLPLGTGMTLAGLLLTLCAAFFWSSGNIVSKRMASPDLLGVVVWSALIPIIPFALLSWIFEGPARISSSLQGMGWQALLAVVYLAFAATILGYTMWGKLLARLPTATVAPLPLMVPLIGLGSAWLLLGEALSAGQIAGTFVVLAGLLVNVFGRSLWRKLRPPPEASDVIASQLDVGSKP